MVFALWSRESLAEDSTVEDTGGWGGVTLAYNVGSPAEVDEVLAEAEAAGATIGRPGAETFWGGYSGCSSIPTGIRGRSRTTRSGRSATTARSRCPRSSGSLGPLDYPRALQGSISPPRVGIFSTRRPLTSLRLRRPGRPRRQRANSVPEVAPIRRGAAQRTVAYSFSSQSVTALAKRATSLRFIARNAWTNCGPSDSMKNGSASSASSASPSDSGISGRSSSS